MTDHQRDPASTPRLLVVSYHLPSAETVAASRPAALAAFADEHGWDVRILTATGADRVGESARFPRVRVIHAPPSPRLPRLGSDPDMSSSAGGPARRVSRLTWLKAGVKGSVRRAGLELLVPDPQVNWIRPALRAFGRAAGDWRPDVVLASAPPFSGFLVAAAIARRLGVPWVADYRDLWSVGNDYWVRSSLRRAIDEKLERRVLRSVTRCVTVSQPLAETLRSTFGVDARVVMNGIDRRPVLSRSVDVRPVSGVRGEATLTLAYTGHLYGGRRDPGPLLAAIALLGDDAARVHVVFAGEDDGIVRAAAERAGVADCVTVLGYVTPEKSWQIQADADVLVQLMWNDPRDAGTVTGKMFDYFQARRPILLLGYEHGVAANLVRERGVGVVHNEPAAIAAQLREWLGVKQQAGAVPPVPPGALDGLFREDQFGPYLQLLREAADGPARTGRG
ncbi:glycosyltransferase [Micromonospora sp. ANENR4]|uniref:glycosyltransferase n=1 Tax=unclassified Micromonospora TaxID=2617518 RepID=UPI0018908A8F|nr:MULTISPECIES: glycosyltransferase [unclassified Micromonospora]MBF5030959.1 glycosyltransferase [Micromonospora sp. ANENR4]MCZ7474327.1 glycosyltransferase [Micromonospora sp. WMMC273]